MEKSVLALALLFDHVCMFMHAHVTKGVLLIVFVCLMSEQARMRQTVWFNTGASFYLLLF